jgi:acyl-CoA thioesterase
MSVNTGIKNYMNIKNKIEKVTLFTGPHEVQLEEWISCAPFEKLLGIKINEAKNGCANLTMPFVLQLAQGKGLAHGGAIVTLADTAVAMAVKSIVPPGSRFGTISLNSEFLAPVKKGVLTAKAKVKFLENRIIKGIATILNEDNIEVMKFSSTFKLAKDVEIKMDKKEKKPSLMKYVRQAASRAEMQDTSGNFNAMSWLEIELEDNPNSFDVFFDVPWNELADAEKATRAIEIRRVL